MTHVRDPRVAWPLVAGLLVAMLLAFTPSPAAGAADTGTEAAFVTLVNRERTARGLAPLVVSAELSAVARDHSVRMADGRRLHHNPDLAGSVRDWHKLGENVGRGARATSISSAFMRSTAHRNNVLAPEWREVGIGVEVRDGVVWVTQVYRAPRGGRR